MNRGLTASQILRIWEWARDRHSVDRALLVLDAAYPELPQETLGSLTIGERDARLFRVRADTLGDRLDAVVTCPNCRSALEFSLRVSELASKGADADRGERLGNEPIEIEEAGIRLRLHRPDSRDLAEIALAPDVEAARKKLLRRCVLLASRDGREEQVQELPEALCDRISTLLAESDPQSDIALDMRCESCGHAWPTVFDIAEFFWIEIEALARRLVGEVATLARFFGWREADILAMSPMRRAAYLDTVTSRA